jgi:hypothetical protein
MRRVCKKVAATHGATPYIMAIAIMYASPTVIVALIEGSRRENKTANTANRVNTLHPTSCGFVIRSQTAQMTTGTDILATADM